MFSDILLIDIYFVTILMPLTSSRILLPNIVVVFKTIYHFTFLIHLFNHASFIPFFLIHFLSFNFIYSI